MSMRMYDMLCLEPFLHLDPSPYLHIDGIESYSTILRDILSYYTILLLLVFIVS